ncbi:2'-5' RNA ligase family protein [Pedobacter steynii]
MSDVYLYSVAIYLPEPKMGIVAGMKNQLAFKGGNYGSRNAKAHITICELNIDTERRLQLIKGQLYRVCVGLSPLNLVFDHFGAYDTGVICILPDKESDVVLKELMKNIRNAIKVRLLHKSFNPHITIGRKLNGEQLSIARDLFMSTKVDLNFICDRIVLRVRKDKGQFEVIEEFIFQSKTQSSGGQLPMFN